MKPTNERVKITIRDPLVRPGTEISTEVSKRYALQSWTDLMEIVRQHNKDELAQQLKALGYS